MSSAARRIVLGIGAALLVGGWGLTRYVDARQAAIAAAENESVTAWVGERTKVATYARGGLISGRTAYLIGVIGMSLGAVIVVVGFQRN